MRLSAARVQEGFFGPKCGPQNDKLKFVRETSRVLLLAETCRAELSEKSRALIHSQHSRFADVNAKHKWPIGQVAAS